uniref:BPTI/Kunitz inhibitor domain-containing protein n=1 Tax=Trichobilharzia regenti TaxID=157069 RepID=A0AA85K535_TRIRE|nr:unnamed protein product [Trichobilharzia regenti]
MSRLVVSVVAVTVLCLLNFTFITVSDGFPTDLYELHPADAHPCVQPIRTGPCRAFFRMYAYDIHSNRCVPFIYGGCLGTQNRFETKRDCQDTCSSFLYTNAVFGYDKNK